MPNSMPDAPLDSMTTSTPPQTPTIKVVDLDEGFCCMSVSDLDSSVDESLLAPHYTPPQTPKRWRGSGGNQEDEASKKDQYEHQGDSTSMTRNDADIDNEVSYTSRATYEERRQWRIQRSQAFDHVNEWFKQSSMESVESTVILASYRLEDEDGIEVARRRNRSYVQRTRRRAVSLPISSPNASKSLYPSTMGLAINTGLERLNNRTCRDDTALNAEELTYEKTYSALELQYRPQSRVMLLACAFSLHSALFLFYLGAIAWRIWTSSLLWPRAPVLHSKLVFCNMVLLVLSCLCFGSCGGAIDLRSLQEYVHDWTSGSWLLNGVDFIIIYVVAKCKTW